jgi:integrase
MRRPFQSYGWGMKAEVRSTAGDIITAEFFDQWLVHMRTRVRAKTWEGYEALLRRYGAPALGSLRLDEVTPLHVQRIYSDLMSAERPLSGGTVKNLHLVLTQAFGQAVRWNLIDRNPTAGAQPPRPKRAEPVVVDAALAHRLLETVAGSALELPVAIALGTGMRRGEILALRWSDLDVGLTVASVRRSVHPTRNGLSYELPKTKRSRRAVMLPAYLTVLLERARDERLGPEAAASKDLVVLDADGSPMHPDSLSSGWRRAVHKAGIEPVRFHDLRHAHATLMLQEGIHPKVVSERLGHASIGITLDVYSHVLPSMQAEAVQALDHVFPPPSSG